MLMQQLNSNTTYKMGGIISELAMIVSSTFKYVHVHSFIGMRGVVPPEDGRGVERMLRENEHSCDSCIL